MYLIFPHIGSMSPVTLQNPRTEVACFIQPADISYFVLILSKKISGANGTDPADVYELCGTFLSECGIRFQVSHITESKLCITLKTITIGLEYPKSRLSSTTER